MERVSEGDTANANNDNDFKMTVRMSHFFKYLAVCKSGEIAVLEVVLYQL